MASEDALVSEDTGGLDRKQADVPGHAEDVPGDPEKSINLDTGGEPPEADPRHTGVTATLSEAAILPEIAPDDRALASDTSATSAFDAEEQPQPAVWAPPMLSPRSITAITTRSSGSRCCWCTTCRRLRKWCKTPLRQCTWRATAARLERALQYLRQTVVNKSRSVLRHRKVVDLHAPKPGAGRAERRARRARDPRALGGRGGAAGAARAAARGHRPALLRGLLRGRHRPGDGDQQGRGEESHRPGDGVAQDDADPGDVMTRPTRAGW